MEVRISMHAGPVYEEFDPILKKRNFFGRHVNQAARIEPIVLPGSVFVSETVAALISFGYEKYDFEYAGNLELGKRLWLLSNLHASTERVFRGRRGGMSDQTIIKDEFLSLLSLTPVMTLTFLSVMPDWINPLSIIPCKSFMMQK